MWRAMRTWLLVSTIGGAPKPGPTESPTTTAGPIAFAFAWAAGDRATVRTVSAFQADGDEPLPITESTYTLSSTPRRGRAGPDREWPEGEVRPDNLLSQATGAFRVAADGGYLGLADPARSVQRMTTLSGSGIPPRWTSRGSAGSSTPFRAQSGRAWWAWCAAPPSTRRRRSRCAG